MKRKWLLVFLAGLAVVLVSLSACSGGLKSVAQGTSSGVQVDLINEPQGIQVSGTGKVTVTPDIALLSLGISAQATTVAEAQSQAQSAMDKVMTALGNSGVANKDIQTQRFSIQQVTHWDDKGQKQIIDGYMVTNIVTAKIRQLDKAGAVIDAVAVAGGDLTRINGISFSIDEPAPLLKQARDKAMADAKAKAEQYASLGGVKLGKPVYIADGGSYYPTPFPVQSIDIGKGVAPATAISPGEMDITFTVQVHYAIAE